MPQTPTPKRYGKICEKHPDLQGLRRVKDSLCPSCFTEKRKAKKAKELADWQAGEEQRKRLQEELMKARSDAARQAFGIKDGDDSRETEDGPQTED